MNHSIKPIRVYRGEYIESEHDVDIAVVAPGGKLIAYYGDAHRLTFARSSMKPFQAIPIVESGALDKYHLSERELSLFCASHNGEPIHRETVAMVLERLGLKEHHLQCGTHIPRDMDSYHKLIEEGKELTPFYSNCSGKHSGMLAGCKTQGFDVDSYRDVTHPYQQQIIDAIADVSSYDKKQIMTSVDGCGAPVHRIPLYNLALAFSRLASPEGWEEGNSVRKEALHRISGAMSAHPEMVAGKNRFDTDLMRAFKGRIVAKGGAEGVHCFGDKETGLGVALKISDGNARGTSVAAMEVLHQLNIGTDAIWEQLHEYHRSPVPNARDEKIGVIQAAFQLHSLE